MIYRKKILVRGKGFCDLINITDQVARVVEESKIKNGLVLIFMAHSTAAITAIEYEPNLIKDFQELMEKLIPRDKSYYHDSTWDDRNGFAHLRASLIGPSLALPLVDRRLELGIWQQVVAIDFDNSPREREITIQIVGEGD